MCGIIGVIGHPKASRLAYFGLYALQHRGQEASGIVAIETKGDEEEISSHKNFGLACEVFKGNSLEQLPGDMALGHVRYSTQGGRSLQNIQPFLFRSAKFGPITIAHNGNLTNAKKLRIELEEKGSIFTSTSDSEVIMHLIARTDAQTFEDCLKKISTKIRGAYSIVLATQKKLYGMRDPYGFRPLVLGKKDEAYILASESCALDLLGAEYIRDINPGELLTLKKGEIKSNLLPQTASPHYCSFESIYFSRPDSLLGENSVYEYRKKMGRILARENPVEADLVIAVPDSGVPAALGYSEEAGLPLELGLVRNHYVGRTFIEPTQQIREFGVKLKLNPISSVLKDKRVVVIDDSLVRGTTSTKIIRMLKDAGAKSIHLRISSPPIAYSCHYGVSTPTRTNLLAAQKTIPQIEKDLGVTSLKFLSLKGLEESLKKNSPGKHCQACFNGLYPEEIFCKIPAAPADEVKRPLAPKKTFPKIEASPKLFA